MGHWPAEMGHFDHAAPTDSIQKSDELQNRHEAAYLRGVVSSYYGQLKPGHLKPTLGHSGQPQLSQRVNRCERTVCRKRCSCGDAPPHRPARPHTFRRWRRCRNPPVRVRLGVGLGVRARARLRARDTGRDTIRARARARATARATARVKGRVRGSSQAHHEDAQWGR
eukprot:scaffold44754_cov57-Phaeocystis_antarctica.AAC.2